MGTEADGRADCEASQWRNNLENAKSQGFLATLVPNASAGKNWLETTRFAEKLNWFIKVSGSKIYQMCAKGFNFAINPVSVMIVNKDGSNARKHFLGFDQ